MPLSEEDENFRGQSSQGSAEELRILTAWTHSAPWELQQQGTEPAPGAPEKVVAGQSCGGTAQRMREANCLWKGHGHHGEAGLQRQQARIGAKRPCDYQRECSSPVRRGARADAPKFLSPQDCEQPAGVQAESHGAASTASPPTGTFSWLFTSASARPPARLTSWNSRATMLTGAAYVQPPTPSTPPNFSPAVL